MPEVLGTDEMIQIRTGYSRSPTGGGIETQIWKGSAAKSRAAYTAYKEGGLWPNLDLTVENGVGTLTLKSGVSSGSDSGEGGTTEENDFWDIGVIDLRKPLSQHPYFNEASEGADNNFYFEILKINKNIGLGKKWTFNAAYLEKSQRYAGLRLGGMEEYMSFAPQINHRIIISIAEAQEGNFIDDIWAKANRVVTLAEIDPPAWLDNALNRFPILVKGGAINAAPALGAYEWLELPAQITPLSGGTHVEISRSYIGAEEIWIGYGGKWDPKCPQSVAETE